MDNHNQENGTEPCSETPFFPRAFFWAKPVQDRLEVRANKMNFTFNPKNLLVGK